MNDNEIKLLPKQRLCPNPTNNSKCYKVLTYSGKYTFENAELKNSKCRSCCQAKLDTGNKTKFLRYCPNPFKIDKCNKFMYYQYEHQFNNAVHENKLCWYCSKFSTRQNKKQHNIERLLSDELEAFYWVGFLLADGCFNRNGIFQLGLSIKDSDHFYKFVKFINYDLTVLNRLGGNDSFGIDKEHVSMRLQDYINVNLICKKFDIHNKKTYNPPNIEVFKSFTINQMKSLVAGFIDGDGTISKSGTIRFGCHFLWIDILKYFATFITDSYSVTNSMNSNCLGIRIVGHTNCRNFKTELLNFKLPLLERKWNRIDESKLTRKQTREIRYSRFVELYQSGLKQNEIAKIISCNNCIITKFVKIFKKENEVKKSF